MPAKLTKMDLLDRLLMEAEEEEFLDLVGRVRVIEKLRAVQFKANQKRQTPTTEPAHLPFPDDSK